MKRKISGKRRDELRHLLHQMREKLIAGIERQLGQDLNSGSGRKIDIAMDTGDWAALELAEGIDHSILELRYRTFKDIAEAFRKLEAETYGICETCGEEITLARLKAEPFARHCVPCLSRIEAFEQAEKEPGKIPSL